MSDATKIKWSSDAMCHLMHSERYKLNVFIVITDIILYMKVYNFVKQIEYTFSNIT